MCVFFSCRKSGDGQSQGDIIVRVKDNFLTRSEVERQIPKGLSPVDSLIRSESIVKKWIIDLLIDDAAYKNVGNEKAEIDRLVNEYRRTLIRHRYQERLVNDKVSAQISEADMADYYEANKEQFKLSENLIKGLFLKVPATAPKMDDVRKWYVSGKEESLENIEKYSLRNAVIFDYFYDRWVNFDEVMSKIPQKISNPGRFLETNDHLEVSDSTFNYFLKVSDKLLAGKTAPFDYVKGQIRNMLINKRKIDFMRKFGEDLYQESVKDGIVEFMKE
jgi:hypothetical protein